MSSYLRGLQGFVGGVGVAMLLLLVTFVSLPDGEAQANSIISQIGAEINGETGGDQSGYSVAMSADGSRVAIGAINNDGTGSNAGHVRVYTLTNNAWTQIGGDINGENVSDQSGFSVAMSADGSRVAIGANKSDGNGSDSGHVRVYTLTNNAWTQTGGDIDGEAAGDETGRSVAMSADGSRVAIGANFNDGTGSNAGHVRVYTLTNNAWTQTGGDIDGENAGDQLGWSVAMSADGSRVAIGANKNDGNGSDSGHVRVYTLTNNAWTQTGGDIDGEAAGDLSGFSVAMSADGSRVAIGAVQTGGTVNGSGHVRVYTLTNNAWTKTGGDIDGENVSDQSGFSVAMSADGSRVAIGARYNAASGAYSGHVRLYTLTNNAWTQTGGDIDGEAASDESGWSVAMSADGSRVAIGANKNSGNGTWSGHVRVYQEGFTPTTTTTTTTIAPTTTTIAPTTTTTPPEPTRANGTLPELSSGVGQMTKEDGTVSQVPVQQVGQEVQIGTSEFYMALALETGSALYDNSSIILKSDLETIVTGAGFKPGSTVEVWLFSTPTLLGTTIVLQDGTFSLPVTVPGNTPAGSHTLQAEGLTTAGDLRAVSAGVIVSKDVASPVVLPETGSQSDGWLIVGMIALIIGTVLVTRRRNLR
jgi:LPXTG-motif cell wall-anchored protein